MSKVVRRNIAFEPEVWEGIQKTDVNVSTFCNEMVKFLLECMAEDDDGVLLDLNNQLLDTKTKIHCEHLRIAEQYEDEREGAERNTELWKEFLKVSEDYFYDINVNKEFLEEIIRITGIHEKKLFAFTQWIHEYQGRDEEKVYNSFNYAFNKYNETTKGSKIYRDSKEIIL